MRGRRRSPGPPPPPLGGYRRDDRRYPTAPRERRRRSISPPDRFRRGGSPPPFKRGRYGRPDDFYPPPHYHDNSYYGGRGSPPRHGDGPRPYKDFCRSLPDDITPEGAQREYQTYLAEYWGGEVRAEWEARKGEDGLRDRFDPRRLRKAAEERDEAARKAAAAFAERLASGALDPKAEGFNQGVDALPLPADEPDGDDASEDADEEAEDGGDRKPAAAKPEAALAPEVFWRPERVAADLALSAQLMAKLDAEKGITANPLQPPAVEDAGAEAAAASSGKEGEAGAAEAKAEAKAEAQDEPMGKAGAEPQAAENGGEQQEGGAGGGQAEPAAAEQKPDAGAQEEALGRLDLQLAYLWAVHAADYYGARELSQPHEYARRGRAARTLRGPRPEEGEQAGEAAEERKGAKAAEKKVAQFWKRRLTDDDPIQAQHLRAERLVEEWIEDQVKRIDDNKWGCKLSQKLFVGKDYVLKHIRLKHTEKVEDARSKILDDLYLENYKRFREEEQREAAKQGGGGGAAGGHAGGQPLGGPMGFGAPGFPAVGPAQMVLPGGVMPGPGQMLVLAPGAGPMGPFVSVPIADGPGRGGFRGGPPMRGRGGRRSGPGGPPFAGGPPAAGRGRGYFDLDNPSNNRAVLDYGDL